MGSIQGATMFEELKVDSKVHYVQPNGAHSEAMVTTIHNKETGVVDLHIPRDDTITILGHTLRDRFLSIVRDTS